MRLLLLVPPRTAATVCLTAAGSPGHASAAAAGSTRKGASRPPPEKSLRIAMELGGLEPPTSWVRSRCIAFPLVPWFAVSRWLSDIGLFDVAIVRPRRASVDGHPDFVEVATGADGIASCTWAIASNQAKQHVRATPPVNGSASHLPDHFSAQRSRADDVRYFPPAGWATLARARRSTTPIRAAA
jgi:hypothetical protein